MKLANRAVASLWQSKNQREKVKFLVLINVVEIFLTVKKIT